MKSVSFFADFVISFFNNFQFGMVTPSIILFESGWYLYVFLLFKDFAELNVPLSKSIFAISPPLLPLSTGIVFLVPILWTAASIFILSLLSLAVIILIVFYVLSYILSRYLLCFILDEIK